MATFAALLLALHSASIAQTPEIEKALQMPEGADRTKALVAAALEWEKKSPAAAMEWVCAPSTPKAAGAAMKSLSMDWAARAPLDEIDWLTKRGLKPGTMDFYALHLTVVVWAGKDPNAALEFAKKQPQGPIRKNIYNSVAEGWGRADIKAAAAWAAKVPDTEDRQTAINFVASFWASTKPEEDAAWAQTLPKDDLKFAASKLVPVWAKKDPAKAVQWVASLPLSDAEKEEILKKK